MLRALAIATATLACGAADGHTHCGLEVHNASRAEVLSLREYEFAALDALDGVGMPAEVLCEALESWRVELRDDLGLSQCACQVPPRLNGLTKPGEHLVLLRSDSLDWLPHELTHVGELALFGRAEPLHNQWVERGYFDAIRQAQDRVSSWHP
jgi:hypothetical protein